MTYNFSFIDNEMKMAMSNNLNRLLDEKIESLKTYSTILDMNDLKTVASKYFGECKNCIYSYMFITKEQPTQEINSKFLKIGRCKRGKENWYDEI